MSLITRVACNKLYPPADFSDLSFTNRTILVTGSSTGLGAEAAYKFATQGAARVILAVRNEVKGAKVQRIVQHVASDPQCKVEVWPLDMLDYESIRSFAKRCEDELERLDVAVLNAGVWNAEYRKSGYGWEETLQVNALSTALLALLLLPKLRASKMPDFTPVLEFVNSGRHYAATLPEPASESSTPILSSLNAPDDYSGAKSYQRSKLILMCVAKTLASQLHPNPESPPDVFVMSVCPGACQSELSRDLNSLGVKAAKLVASALFLRTTEEGSRTLVSGTAQGQGGHGEFWQNDVIREPAAMLREEEGKEFVGKVWKEVVEVLGKDVDGTEVLVEQVREPAVGQEEGI